MNRNDLKQNSRCSRVCACACKAFVFSILSFLMCLLFAPAGLFAAAEEDPDSVICVPEGIPYVCAFDQESAAAWNQRGVLPSCWDFQSAATDSAYFPHVSTDFALYGNSLLLTAGADNPVYGTDCYVILPEQRYKLNDMSFTLLTKMESVSRGQLSWGYWRTLADTAEFVRVEYISSFEGILSRTFSMRGYNIPDDVRLALCWHNTDSCAHCAIDSIVIDSLQLCLPPTITSVSAMSDSEIEVRWTPGWNERIWMVEYGPTGFTHGNGQLRYVYETDYMLSGLSASTVYDVYVRGICNNGSSTDWSYVMQTMTPCESVQLPYYENFDSYQGTEASTPGVVPSCWNIYSAAAIPGNYPHVSPYLATTNNGLVMTSAEAVPYGGANYVILPWFESDLNGAQISFNVKMENYRLGVLTLGYFTNVLDPSSFVDIEVIPNSASQTTSELRQVSLHHRNIPSNARLAFRWYYGATNWNAYCGIDDIAVEFLECPPVTNVAVSDVMMTTATLTWSPGEDETSWRVEYGPAGFQHEDAQHTTLTVSDTVLHLTGLTGGQPLDVYVQSMCDPRNPSLYSDVLTFTPYCSVLGDTAVVVSCDSFEWHGRTYSETGFYIDTLRQAATAFCDSIVALDLTIHPSYNQYDTLVLCQNELPYVWRDTLFDTGSLDSNFIFHKISVENCDSVVNLHLVVNPAYYQEEFDTICQQSLPYTWRDTVFEAGTVSDSYVFTRQTIHGCDSIVTLHLLVNESYYQMEIAEICQQELPYTWRDTTFAAGSQSSVVIFNRESISGCDSIVTLALVIHPSYNEDVSLNICSNELPYVWRDTTFGEDTQNSVFVFHRQTAFGCDSIVNLTLTIGEESGNERTLDICENDLPYVWEDTVFRVGTQSGTFYFDRSFEGGCSGQTILHLNVHPAFYAEISESVCSQDFPTQLEDSTFEVGTQTGDYIFHYTTAFGCDSVIVLHLNVNQGVEEYETLNVCRGELPYTWRDTTFRTGSMSGDYTFSRQTATGCDSVVRLTLNVHEGYAFTEYLTVCENELPVVWHGNVIPRGTTSGTLTFTGTTSFGCDSIVVLRLTVNPSFNQSEELTICANELPYIWRDTTFEVGSLGGSFIFEKQTASGCDSIVRLKLKINPAVNEDMALTICESELQDGYAWRDTTFMPGTESAAYTFNRQTSNGCDSIVTLHLTVNQTYAQQETYAVCASELPMVWRDTVFAAGTQSGTYVFHRRAVSGCDSIVTLDLTIYPLLETFKSYTICREELPYTIEDTTFGADAVSGTYKVHYVGQYGCDSIVSINLTVNPNYNMTEAVVICQNELPYTWRDTVFEIGTQSNVYQFIRKTVNGQCDSLVSLALLVHPSYEQEEYIDVCANDFPYTWRDTTFYSAVSSDFTFSRHTVNGCDSIVHLHLQVHPVFNQTESFAICQSDLPYTWRDTTFQIGTISGIHTFHRLSQYGCDSTVMLWLTVNPTMTTTHNLQICSDDLPYSWPIEDTVFEMGSVSGTYFFHHTNISGCDSNVVLNLIINQAYSYTDELTICANELPYYYEPENYFFPVGTTSGQQVFRHQSVTGCDSILTLSLTVNPSYNESVTIRLCDNEFPYVWRDTVFMDGTMSGNYVFQRNSQYGCDSMVTLTLFVYPQPFVQILGNTHISMGDTTTLLAQGTANCSYHWNTGETGNSITVWPDTTTEYEVTIVSNSGIGCSNTASVIVIVDDTSSLADVDLTGKITVYPNPTDGQVNVRSEQTLINELYIYDMMGRQIRRLRVDALNTTFDLRDFATGTYILQLKMENGVVVRKKVLLTR